MTQHKHTIFLTGAAGYVGGMLVDQWAERDDVAEIIALDMEAPADFIANKPNITWIKANTSDHSWQDQVREKNPDIVIHAAWQIRNLHFEPKKQWLWNVTGSKDVFDFTFSLPSVNRLIYFSTASIFGAYPDNEIDELFAAEAPLRKEEYLYSKEKRVVEEELRARIEKGETGDVEVSIVRPAAVTGPRGRYSRIRFGLQSALSGDLKGNIAYSFVKLLTSVVPATEKWCRQFIHEDDITDILTILTFTGAPHKMNLYNLAPPGDVVLPKDMGEATGKNVVILPPWVVRVVFFFMRHLTFGKVPTAAGAWRFYSYPIVMDGTKVTKELGHQYAYDSVNAFSKTAGRYEHVVPENLRK